VVNRITWSLGAAVVLVAIFARPLGHAVSAIGGAAAAIGGVVVAIAFLASPLIEILMLANDSKSRQSQRGSLPSRVMRRRVARSAAAS
jgi:hypothetical protein